MPRRLDAASSKYQNNVFNTNIYSKHLHCQVQIYYKKLYVTLSIVTNTFLFAPIYYLKTLLNSLTLIFTGSTINSGRL